VIATDIPTDNVTSALLACAVSLANVQARTRMCVCVDSLHVKETAFPVFAFVVHCVEAPEPAAVIVDAPAAAAQAGGLETAVVPDW